MSRDILDAQPQAGHDGGLLHDQFVAVVGAARMIEIEDERQVVLGVIFRAEIALLERAVGARALARVVHPADQVIVVVLFADAAQIGREGAADHVRRLRQSNGRPGSRAIREAPCRARRRPEPAWASAGPVSAGLPDERGDGLNFVGLQAELRHLGGGAELVRVLAASRGSTPCGSSCGLLSGPGRPS